MVVASLSTIPPRIDDECRQAIDSLLDQVDKIYLCVAPMYRRFGPLTIPSYLHSSPYRGKVVVVIGEDYGAATKYLGSIDHCDDWVFVCDDDQEYKQGLVERMLSVAKETSRVYQNRYGIFDKYGTSGGLIHGYVGLLIHSSQLKALKSFAFPEAARFVDDQWMSAYCFLNKIRVEPTGIEEYADIFQVLDGNYEKKGKESLADLSNRNEMIQELSNELGVRFVFIRK